MQTLYDRAPEALRTQYIWLISLLDVQQAGITLQLERAAIQRRNWTAKRPSARSMAVVTAMWQGAMALEERAKEYAQECRDRGQLLFAHPDTTVLQGGAA